ncbi:type II secretion system minor pseudopilin GspJ [Photobacterium sp. BZF1]|uniref:type II secretion system minor pseudopilin GspJ n=1 Tax=Photobacterium sp. BZF1 TaxID=1904457 RepID=UPI001653E046|nr:type II secretion system minor pseudopilin GspJ [Photobacterium sp. BZF1]MBC7003237.1 type II secretion system minor pseudopilin GspJ [Photobacterium sp. BZF1]
MLRIKTSSGQRPPRLNSAKQAGFTLLEVLVAIAVFAMLSLSAYQVMNGVQRSDEQSREHSERLKDIQRAMVMMDNDFRQVVARKVRNQGETTSDRIFQSSEYLMDSSSYGILFTRTGWQNPQQMFPRGENVKVGYRIVDDQLERVWFRYPDSVVGTEALIRPILSGVEEMSFRFYSEKKWLETWDKPAALPEGVMIKLTLEDYGEIERVYMLPTSALEASNDT